MNLLSRFTKRLLLDYSPLEHLYEHAKIVTQTVEELAFAINKYIKGEEVRSDKVSQLEHEADKIKQKIRNKLPRSDLLMPVARTDVLSFLWQQDQIADSCQDAAAMLSLLTINLSSELSAGLSELSELISQGASIYLQMVKGSTDTLVISEPQKRIDELWETIEKMNDLEHQADLVEREMIKTIYKDGRLDGFEKYHLIQVVLMCGNAVDHMENASQYLRIMTSR